MATTKKSTEINLFGAAKVETKKTKSTDDKKTIRVTDPTVSKAINDLVEGRKAEKKAKAQQDTAEAILKPYALGEWMKELKATTKRPDSFIMANDDNGILYIAQDSYKKIDEERAGELKEKYGDAIVETEEEFIIDKDIIEKYAAEISKAIMGIKTIPDEMKLAMFTKRVNYKVAKGTIDNIVKIAADNKTTPETIWSEITPTQQLKPQGEK